MPDLYDKRQIEELVARYELEPTIRDIYVEGNSDKVIIEWLLQNVGLEDVVVYEIDTVNVPYEELVRLGLNDSKRSRVITLAFALHSGASIDLTPIVACIADTDFDFILEKTYNCPILIFTGYTSIEAYLYNEDVIRKFLTLVIRNFPYESAVVMSELAPVLRDLFLIRLANQELDMELEYMSFERCCTVSGSQLHFDIDSYIYRYLNKGALLSKREDFERMIARYREKISGDSRMYIHGHDLISLLLFYIAKIKKPRRNYDPDFFSRSLFGVLEINHVVDTPLFMELSQRFKRD